MHSRTPISFSLMSLILILLINLSIIGIILIGFSISLEEPPSISWMTRFLILSMVSAGYLGIRLHRSPERLNSRNACTVYSTGMVVSAVLPLAAYLVFDFQLANLSITTLFLSQTVFMVIVLWIKLSAIKHAF